MEIAAFVLTHNNPQLTFDTVDSVRLWMTDKVMVLVDAVGWGNFLGSDPKYDLCRGLPHGRPRSPFRNILFGMKELYLKHPNVDWYCYCENDVLFIGDQFKRDIEKAKGKMLLGTNYRRDRDWELPLLNRVVGGEVREQHYVLGCLMFMHRKFVAQLAEWSKSLLRETERFESGFFPDFHGYAFEEQLFPSLANYFKAGSVQALSFEGRPHPNYISRFRPEINQSEVRAGATFLHPVKNADDPIRLHYRKLRNKILK